MKIMPPKLLSIITINYNNAEGLKKTMDSVLNQTFKDFEYIIIDGGSTDSSVEKIKNVAAKIDYWVSEKDKGIYNAMNKGIARTNGEYVLFVNSGDLLACDTILEEVKPCLRNAEIICGDYKVVSKNKTWIKQYPDNLSFSHFIYDSLSHSAAAFTKKSAFKGELAKYDEGLKIVSDWKWYLLGIFKYNYSYRHIPKIIGVFDFSGNSATNPELTKKEKDQVFKNDFRNIYQELIESAVYKTKFETLNNSRFLNIYFKLKKIISRK